MHVDSLLRDGAIVALAALLAIGVAPVALYTGLLTLAAPFARRTPPDGPRRRRFAVLVPAHDEEAVIGRTLASLAALDYPRDRVDVWVVADNCIDGTAAIVRGQGARVLERRDPTRAGKGFALAWLLARLREAGERYDGYVIVDADSVLSPNYLRALEARLDRGAQAVQGYYAVLPLHGTRAEALRGVALALVHYLRPAAKSVLGLSCGLKGNGMCFAPAVIARFGWPTAGLAEDVEFNLLLAAAGIRVEFAPEAVVRAEIPPTLRAAAGQNRRWEAGRVAALRGALPLLLRGLRRRDATAIDAGIEQMVPPLSVPVALAAIGAVAGAALGTRALWLPSLTALAVFALHVVAGLLLARATRAEWRALLLAPVYVGWKVALYARVLVGPRQRAWVRTRHGV